MCIIHSHSYPDIEQIIFMNHCSPHLHFSKIIIFVQFVLEVKHWKWGRKSKKVSVRTATITLYSATIIIISSISCIAYVTVKLCLWLIWVNLACLKVFLKYWKTNGRIWNFLLELLIWKKKYLLTIECIYSYHLICNSICNR